MASFIRGYKQAKLVFANQKLLARDRFIYRSVQNMFDEDTVQIEYSIVFDPKPEEEEDAGGDEEDRPPAKKTIWIIDECDSIMFEKPTEFMNKLKQMPANDALICLTATPFKKGTDFGLEKGFLDLCKFSCIYYNGEQMSKKIEYDHANFVFNDDEAVKRYVDTQRILHPVLIYAVKEEDEPYA